MDGTRDHRRYDRPREEFLNRGNGLSMESLFALQELHTHVGPGGDRGGLGRATAERVSSATIDGTTCSVTSPPGGGSALSS